MSYFGLFPSILYANVAVTDVTRRVTVPPSVLRRPTAFYPYTVTDNQRQDSVSFLYYGQDDDDWLIGLANQIVDPYYGWHMDDDELNSFLEIKYGSLPDAMVRIDHWLCNWADDPSQITIAHYGALTENLRKYWIPVFAQGSEILSYRRRQEDWTVTTNTLLDVHMTDTAPFETGELCTVYGPGPVAQGTGELVWVSEDIVRIKNMTGTWEAGNTLETVSGTGTIDSVEDPVRMIPIDEIVYFSPVTCYDVEYDKNEKNKEVLLIQESYRGQMYSDLTQALKAPVT
jgi:hypothetical protein